MAKHTETIRRPLPTNSLSVIDRFVGLVIKGLTMNMICLLILDTHSCLCQRSILDHSHKNSQQKSSITDFFTGFYIRPSIS